MIERKKLPLQEQLFELFNYKDGFLYWNTQPSFNVDISEPAGSIRKSDNRYIVQIGQKKYYGHRLIYKYFYNQEPNFIDHVNEDPSDNRIENLQEITRPQNMLKGKLRHCNTSGHKGVVYNKRLKKWIAQIGYNGTTNHIGCFNTLKEAANARKEVEGLFLENIRLDASI